jgi:hypothetical protein
MRYDVPTEFEIIAVSTSQSKGPHLRVQLNAATMIDGGRFLFQTEPALGNTIFGVAFRIIWHTSELIIWRTGCESGAKMCVACRFLRNSRLQTLLGTSEGTLGTIVCQIIRTRMCQIISKTTIRCVLRCSNFAVSSS